MPVVTVGPVIGKVDHDSARILVELDGDAELTCRVSPENGAGSASQTLSVRANLPTVFEVRGLAPDTTYRTEFAGATAPVAGRFRTMDDKATTLDSIVLADDHGVFPGLRDLWSDVWRRYIEPAQPPFNLLIHAGNQVDASSAFVHARALLAAKGHGTARVEAAVLERFRDLYRNAWTRPAKRRVLANVPNLMIWNDLEIRERWGDAPSDRASGDPEAWIGSLARRVYREYQRELWDACDTEATPTSGFEHHIHRFGTTGLVFVDVRGGRSFEPDAARPFLGTPQWEQLAFALSSEGELDQARALIIVTPTPLALLSGAPADWIDGCAGHWSYHDHRREQLEMLRALRRWVAAKPGREVLTVGGGVGLAGISEFRHDGEVFARQMLLPPITAPPMGALTFEGLAARLAKSNGHISGSYSCEHGRLDALRGYGVVAVRAPTEGAARIVAEFEAE